MKILILNWRSLKDPLSGGAELATFEFAKRWVSAHNAKVVWLSPKYDSKIDHEIIEGVEFKYIGLKLERQLYKLIFTFPLFYILVAYNYVKYFKKDTDVVIDQVHGIPYLTPLYVKKPIIVHVNEIAGDIWDKMYKFPINKIGKTIEKFIFKPYIKNKSTFVAISQGTKQDVLKLGIDQNNTHIVYCGVSMPAVSTVPIKEADFTLMYLNRLVPMKGIERAIEIFNELHKTLPNSKLWIVGRGEATYVEKLQKRVRELNLKEDVTFFGFVDDPTKMELLSKAHVLINTSYKEGWGLVNIEANRRATPVVAFNVFGNRESVADGVSGYLAQDSDISDFVEKIISVYKNKELQMTALQYAHRFNWDRVAEEYYNIIEKSVQKNV